MDNYFLDEDMRLPDKILQTLLAFMIVSLALAEELPAQTNSSANIKVVAEKRAREEYDSARKQYKKDQKNADVAWQFARAVFDWAEFARSDRERAELAEEGIAAARLAIKLSGGKAAAHYYLGMNLGQLARTKSLGALKLVQEMEREFKTAREIDEQLDFAGPDRNLGLLYLEAPAFSVGDRKKAKVHLLRAVELQPDYPENRLNLAEAYLRWDDKTAAHAEFLALEKIWDTARKELRGETWEAAWADWEKRRAALRQQLGNLAAKQ